jgi:hypothetical protein
MKSEVKGTATSDLDLSAQSDTLPMTQMKLLTCTSHSGLTKKPTVPVVHRITGGPSGSQQTESPHISIDPSVLSILTATHEDQLHSQASYKDLTQDTTDTGLCSVERFPCHV